MARYSVLVEDKDTGSIKDYVIGVKNYRMDEEIGLETTEERRRKQSEHNSKINDNPYGNNTDPLMCLELSKVEYEHSFRRSEKFDNKVYTLLTVCGFLFVVIVNAISSITDIEVCKIGISIWIFVFDIFLVISILLTMLLLGLLIYSLYGIELKRYDSNLTMEMNLPALDKSAVARFAIMEYEIAKKYNNDKINKRFKRLNKSVCVLIIDVVLLMVLSVSGSFAKTESRKYNENIKEIQERNIDDVINEIYDDLEYLRKFYNDQEVITDKSLEKAEINNKQTDSHQIEEVKDGSE